MTHVPLTVNPAELVDAYSGPTSPRDLELAQLLHTLWVRATEAWPTVKLAPEPFMRHLATRTTPATLATTRVEDLYLAYACLEGQAAALAVFDQHVISKLDRALESLDSSRAFIDEVRQRVRERLLVRSPQSRPRLEEYAGQGTLVGWARTVAVRLALNLKRDTAKERPHDDEALAKLPLTGANLELDYIRSQHRADFSAAFREALESLSAKDRNVLRLSYVDRLSIDQIGSIYGAHRATAARWLNAARDQLVQQTRERLAQRLRLTHSDVNSLLGALQSNLEISLNRFLRAGESEEHPS